MLEAGSAASSDVYDLYESEENEEKRIPQAASEHIDEVIAEAGGASTDRFSDEPAEEMSRSEARTRFVIK